MSGTGAAELKRLHLVAVRARDLVAALVAAAVEDCDAAGAFCGGGADAVGLGPAEGALPVLDEGHGVALAAYIPREGVDFVADDVGQVVGAQAVGAVGAGFDEARPGAVFKEVAAIDAAALGAVGELGKCRGLVQHLGQAGVEAVVAELEGRQDDEEVFVALVVHDVAEPVVHGFSAPYARGFDEGDEADAAVLGQAVHDFGEVGGEFVAPGAGAVGAGAQLAVAGGPLANGEQLARSGATAEGVAKVGGRSSLLAGGLDLRWEAAQDPVHGEAHGVVHAGFVGLAFEVVQPVAGQGFEGLLGDVTELGAEGGGEAPGVHLGKGALVVGVGPLGQESLASGFEVGDGGAELAGVVGREVVFELGVAHRAVAWACCRAASKVGCRLRRTLLSAVVWRSRRRW